MKLLGGRGARRRNIAPNTGPAGRGLGVKVVGAAFLEAWRRCVTPLTPPPPRPPGAARDASFGELPASVTAQAW